MNITKKQRDLLRSVLGIKNKYETACRNSEHRDRFDDCMLIFQDLVSNGYMEKSSDYDLFYKVTEKGVLAALYEKEKAYHRRIRVGDTVKIINPIFVESVGYPLTKKKILKEIMTREDVKKIDDFIRNFILSKKTEEEKKEDHFLVDGDFVEINEKVFDEIVDALAYGILRDKNYGGRTRMLHTLNEPDYKGVEFIVQERKIVHTGTYHPASGGYSSWGDDCYDPAYLDIKDTHILLYNNFSPSECYKAENPFTVLTSSDDVRWLALDSRNVKKVNNTGVPEWNVLFEEQSNNIKNLSTAYTYISGMCDHHNSIFLSDEEIIKSFYEKEKK